MNNDSSLPYQLLIQMHTLDHHLQSSIRTGRISIPVWPHDPWCKNCWLSHAEVGIVAISRDEAEKLPNKTSMLPHDEQQRYVIGVDVFHALHCLVGHSGHYLACIKSLLTPWSSARTWFASCSIPNITLKMIWKTYINLTTISSTLITASSTFGNLWCAVWT